jgi:hypothetical protein
MSEIGAMLENAERDFAAGKCYTTEDVLSFIAMRKSFTT